jgi:hypothetical protein
MGDPTDTDEAPLRVPLNALADPAFREELEALSTAWFGTMHRLTVCFVLRHSDGVLQRSDLIERVGLTAGAVSREARFLTRQGVITSHQPERIVFHERIAHPYWSLFDRLVEDGTSWLAAKQP